jgi:hypothetical protein
LLSPGGSDKAGNVRRQGGNGGLTATPAIKKDMLPHGESYGWYRFGLGLIRGWFVPRMMFVLTARFDGQGVAKL